MSLPNEYLISIYKSILNNRQFCNTNHCDMCPIRYDMCEPANTWEEVTERIENIIRTLDK